MRLSKKEQKALFFLAGTLLIVMGLQWLSPGRENTRIYDYTLKDSLFSIISRDTIAIQKPAATVHKRKKSSLKININRATAAQLQTLPGIGPATAEKIIQYRRENGPFTSYQQLLAVPRIGPKTLQKIKPHIRLK